jgi:hypothetical protein
MPRVLRPPAEAAIGRGGHRPRPPPAVATWQARQVFDRAEVDGLGRRMEERKRSAMEQMGMTARAR